MIKLSILICSLESRKNFLDELRDELHRQLRYILNEERVQIMTYIDQKQKTTGFKRQYLLEKSKGDYIVFIDDDDKIAHYYIQEMLRGCESGADCLAINGTYTCDGQNETRWELSKDNDDVNVTTPEGKPLFLRRTNHITAVKREIALAAGFPDLSNGEDKYYSQRLVLKTEFKIDSPMYHYRYISTNKEY